MNAIRRYFKAGDYWLDFFVYPFMLFIFVVMLYPFLNVAAIAFNDSTDTVRGGIHIWPREFTLVNFRDMINHAALPVAARNSVLRTVIGTVSSVTLISMTAYVLSRYDYVFRKPITLMLTISMYVTGGLIPGFLLIRSLGLMGTFSVYIIPGIIAQFSVIIMLTYMRTIPISLQESAMIDGASDFFIYSRIIMPLCLPSIATIVLFTSVGQWNSWFDAYLFNPRHPELTVLQFELQKILANTVRASAELTGRDMVRQMAEVTPRSMQMAITVVVTTPIVMVYPFIQRYLIKGMMIGSVKG